MVGDGQHASRSEIAAPAFVGREPDVAALTQALRRPPAVVLVEAEAGGGKSRLVQEFLAGESAAGHRLLVAVCPPFREALTLGPVVDAVRDAGGETGDQAGDTISGLRLSPLAGALRPLLPEWAAYLPPTPPPLDDAKAERHRLFRALAELVRALDVTGLVVEDVHWADPVTMEFLVFLASQRPAGEQHRPSLVITYRPAELPEDSLVWRMSSRLPAGTTQVRVSLAPFDVTQTARMVSSMLDHEQVSTEFASYLHERTGGVPLAVEESVRLLRDRADLFRRDGEWIRRRLPDLQVSPTIRDSVLERVRRLSPSARRVLQAAAVFAEPAIGRTVAAVAGLPAGVAHGALTEAVASGLLQEDDAMRLSFRHAFMRQVVYEAVPGAERRRLHTLAAQTLERRDPPPVVQLTRHFREAGHVTKWCEYAEQAAARAVAGGDPTTATGLLVELLTGAELLESTEFQLAWRLATTALVRRENVDELHHRVVATLRQVLARSPLCPRRQAQIRNPLGRLLAQAGDLAGARTELERAIPHLSHDSAEAGRAMTYLGWPWLGSSPAPVHRQWLARAAEVDHSRLSADEHLGLTADRATALLQLGEDEGWRVADSLPTVSASDSAELRRQRARACLNLTYAAMLWGRYDRAEQWLSEGERLTDPSGHPRLYTKLAMGRADLAWLTGAWGELDQLLVSLTDAEDGGEAEPLLALNVTRLRGMQHLLTGAYRRAEECFTNAVDNTRILGAAGDALEPAAALGRLRLAEGRVAEALALTGGPMEPVVTKQMWLFATELAPVRVEALVTAGRLTEAEELVDAYARGLAGRDAPAPGAALLVCRALVAHARSGPQEAAARFAHAAAVWDTLPRPYEALRAREWRAECLLVSDRDREEGEEALTCVWQGFADLGARADEERVSRRLRERGVETRRPWRGGRRGYGDQPSPREREVVRLVLAGKTNREIAQQLHKSPRTVAGQLASVMRKLGVSSRTELAVRAVEDGLVEAEDDTGSGTGSGSGSA